MRSTLCNNNVYDYGPTFVKCLSFRVSANSNISRSIRYSGIEFIPLLKKFKTRQCHLG